MSSGSRASRSRIIASSPVAKASDRVPGDPRTTRGTVRGPSVTRLGSGGRLLRNALLMDPDQFPEADPGILRNRLDAPLILRGVLPGGFWRATERRSAERKRLSAFQGVIGVADLHQFAADLGQRQRGPADQTAMVGTVNDPSMTRPNRHTNSARLSQVCILTQVGVVPTGSDSVESLACTAELDMIGLSRLG